MSKIATVAKAIAAGAAAFSGALGTAVADNTVTSQEWVGVAIATVLAAAAVWGIPNAAVVNGKHEAGAE